MDGADAMSAERPVDSVAQVLDMDVDGIGVRFAGVVPALLEQLHAIQYLFGVAHQALEQVELLSTQPDFTAVT